jgi:hypothetical protein
MPWHCFAAVFESIATIRRRSSTSRGWEIRAVVEKTKDCLQDNEKVKKAGNERHLS